MSVTTLTPSIDHVTTGIRSGCMKPAIASARIQARPVISNTAFRFFICQSLLDRVIQSQLIVLTELFGRLGSGVSESLPAKDLQLLNRSSS